MKDSNEYHTLLPERFARKMDVAEEGSKISLRDIERESGRSMPEVFEEISAKLCSLPVKRAQDFWTVLEDESKFELAFNDRGSFNLALIEKLELSGSLLQEAFISMHAKSIFLLDSAPLFTQIYQDAFATIHSELLSTCKQLFSAKSSGVVLLNDFLSRFDPDFLASVVRHEIAQYYVSRKDVYGEWSLDEEEFGLIDDDEEEFNLMEDDEEEFDCPGDEEDDFDEFESDKTSDITSHREKPEEADFFSEPSEREEFARAFSCGDIIPPYLVFTHWLQHHAPGVYGEVRSILIFVSSERQIPLWERPNPMYQEINTGGTLSTITAREGKELLPIDNSNSGDEQLTNHAVSGFKIEIEINRLIALYCNNHPRKKKPLKGTAEPLTEQGRIIAELLTKAAIDTRSIQSFEQLKCAIWSCIGFSSVKDWLSKQEQWQQLLKASCKERLFADMNILGVHAFYGPDAIFDSLFQLQTTRNSVSKLYGWLCLVKLFRSLAKQRPRFNDLASVENGVLVWKENISCSTLIFQAVLGTESLFFSLAEIRRFCEVTREPEWTTRIKASLKEIAEENDARSAVPILWEYVDILSYKGSNVFRVADEINIATSLERELVKRVRTTTFSWQSEFMRMEDEENFEALAGELWSQFTVDISRIAGIGSLKREALEYLLQLLASFNSNFDLSKFRKLK